MQGPTISTLYSQPNLTNISARLKKGKYTPLSRDTSLKPDFSYFAQADAIIPKAKSQVEKHCGIQESKELLVHEVKQTGKDGLIRSNNDIEPIHGVHPKYICCLDQVLKEEQDIEGVDKRCVGSIAGKADPKKHILPKSFTTTKIGDEKIELDGATGGASTIRVVALVKAAHMNIIFGRDDGAYTICFGSGHWVRLKDIQGDHAYPGSFVVGRLYRFFADDNSIPKKGKKSAEDPRKKLNPNLKFTASNAPEGILPKNEPNKGMLMLYYSDSKNLIGLCGTCNSSKGENFIKHLRESPCYGNNFINAHFPLNYSTIIPRSKDGQGLGDAMMMFFFTTHALNVGLNVLNTTVAKPEDVKIEDTEITKGQAKSAIEIVNTLGALKLSDKQKKQLHTLLVDLTSKIE